MYITYIIYRVCVVYVQVVYKTVDGRTLYHALTQICQKFTPPYMWLNTLLGIFIETINLFFYLILCTQPRFKGEKLTEAVNTTCDREVESSVSFPSCIMDTIVPDYCIMITI